MERRGVFLSEILEKNGQGFPGVSPSGSLKAKSLARDVSKSEPKRWTDLMREGLVSTSHREQQGPEYSGLKDIRPINELFKRALSYNTYRLRERNEQYDGEVGQQLTKIYRRMKHAMLGKEFSRKDEIAVLVFLKNISTHATKLGLLKGQPSHF